MMVVGIERDGWVLAEAVESDVDSLMKWFPDKDAIHLWGGPDFRYPFNRHSFVEDMYWGRMASVSLRDPHKILAAFGQFYERYGRINLARLVVHPKRRGQGVGRRLITMLMEASRQLFDCPEYSLFVFRDNKRAYDCYRSLGFEVTDYPNDMPHADVCYYLTRAVLKKED